MKINVTQTSDKEHVKEIRAALKANDGYCPCRLEHTVDTKCMCKEFRDQIENEIPGDCHCGLYTLTIER